MLNINFLSFRFSGFLITSFTTCFMLATISSCKVYQPAAYFKEITRDTIIKGFQQNDVELKIQSKDVIAIIVSSLNPTEDAFYNTLAATGIKGYQVDLQGNIYLHKLGKLSVTGLTRRQLKDKLEVALQPYLKDPIVNVGFANHRVIIFGDAGSQVIEMAEEKISLLEVLAKSNAGAVNSELKKVLVIRETNNAKEFKYLNLEDAGFITSPWYYLQPDDVVVVKPNAEKILDEDKRTRNQFLYATLISAVTFVLLIADRIFR